MKKRTYYQVNLLLFLSMSLICNTIPYVICNTLVMGGLIYIAGYLDGNCYYFVMSVVILYIIIWISTVLDYLRTPSDFTYELFFVHNNHLEMEVILHRHVLFARNNITVKRMLYTLPLSKDIIQYVIFKY